MNTVFVHQIAFVTGAYEGDDWSEVKPIRSDSAWFDPVKYLGKKGHRYYSDAVKYALAASKGLFVSDTENTSRSAVCLGTSSADYEPRREIMQGYIDAIQTPVTAAYAPNTSVNIAAGLIAKQYQLQGPSYTFTGQYSASMMALWQAQTSIARGELDYAIVGQVEYRAAHPERCGAILWSLGSTPQPDSIGAIAGIKRTRSFLPPRRFEAARHAGVVVASDDAMYRDFMALQTQQQYTRRSTSALSAALDPTFYPFTELSLLVLNRTQSNTCILSPCGHIFYFALNE